jgi:hypothetical protein
MKELSRGRVRALLAKSKSLIVDQFEVQEFVDHITIIEDKNKRLSERLDEYRCGWDRQQGIINNLSEALQAQEVITLNNLKDYFTFKGFLNSIQPDELESYISKVKK